MAQKLICYRTRRAGQFTVLILTFFAYAGLHVTRKAFSNIKTNLAYPVCDSGNVFGAGDRYCCTSNLISQNQMLWHSKSEMPTVNSSKIKGCQVAGGKFKSPMY